MEEQKKYLWGESEIGLGSPSSSGYAEG